MSIPLVLHRLNPGRISPPYSRMKLLQRIAPESWRRKAPPFLGEERRGVYRVGALLFLLFEGKRKLECLILDGDAQHQLLWIFATLEPDRAGNLVVGFDGCRFERQGQDLLRSFVQSLFALQADGVFFSVLMLNDVVRRGSR